MKEDLRAASRATARQRHSHFVSKLGHELRTPLGSVLMMAELLAENSPGNLDDKQLGYARRIHRAASEMRALLDEVSTLAKIEGGRLELFPEALSLSELGRWVEEQYRIGVELEGGLPATLETDRSLLEQILTALIDSAVGAAGRDAVTVRIAPSGRDTVSIAVAEVAGGVPEGRRETIFEPFNPADPRTRRRGGGGQSLALPIARSLARLLGGELTVAGEGGGAAFVLELPARG